MFCLYLHLQSLAESYANEPGRAPATHGRDLPLALHPPTAQGCCEPRVHGQGGRDVGQWAALAAKPLWHKNMVPHDMLPRLIFPC